jgi:hypothetical protein
MVSAKFNIVGEDGDWFRIRAQEEIYHHGLEGDVLSTGEKTLVVIVDGDKSVIKTFHSEMKKLCPEGVACTGLIFSLQRPIAGLRIKHPGKLYGEQTLEFVLETLKEMERRITRIDQNVAKLIAMQEGGWRPRKVDDQEEPPQMEVKEEATSGFASMFGD